MISTISKQIEVSHAYRVLFTDQAFDPENACLRDLIAEARDHPGQPSKVLFVIDESLTTAFPRLESDIRAYASAHPDVLRLAADPVRIPGGEASKNDFTFVETLWSAIHDAGICRHSYVVAIGGGAVLDLAGFAAATAHRGVRHIRMPTTTLSQGDGGVGVKNGVNYFGKKNWVGTFAVPFAVVSDSAFLTGLPERESRAGVIEAIKVSLIRDAGFFDWIESHAAGIAKLEIESLKAIIRRSAELHMNHIAEGGDPFELGSARPLDFGHWAAHRLEQLSGFGIRHGEAVAIGMAVDLIYARRAGLLDAASESRILELIQRCGFGLYDESLKMQEQGELAVIRGLQDFREHLGGELTVTLVTGIGTSIEVHEMDEALVSAVIDEMEARFGPGKKKRAATIPAFPVSS